MAELLFVLAVGENNSLISVLYGGTDFFLKQ
jgi:hypothetical protein